MVALLVTGFGKTLCTAHPAMFKYEESPIVLVISPLTTLMKDHVNCFQNCGISAAKLGPEMETSVLEGIY